MNDNGWRDIGYHFVGYLDGTIEEGRPLSQEGAGVYGHNRDNIHICYVGGVDANDVNIAQDTRTEAQVSSIRGLLQDLTERFPSIVRIAGHNEFDPGKACPSFDVPSDTFGNIDGFTNGRRT